MGYVNIGESCSWVFRGEPMTIETGVGSQSLQNEGWTKKSQPSVGRSALKRKQAGQWPKCFEGCRYLFGGCGSQTARYLLIFGFFCLWSYICILLKPWRLHCTLPHRDCHSSHFPVKCEGVCWGCRSSQFFCAHIEIILCTFATLSTDLNMRTHSYISCCWGGSNEAWPCSWRDLEM